VWEITMRRALRIAGWTFGVVTLLVMALPAIAFGPMVARCTQTAEGWLASADSSLKSPSEALRDAVRTEVRLDDPANWVTKMLILRSGCSGWTPERGHDHIIDEVVMLLPLKLWFTADELRAIGLGRSYMGKHPETDKPIYGLSDAARVYYGSALGELQPAALKCLLRKTRGPNHPRYRCGGAAGLSP
jgi:hypothetical protein